MNIDMYQHNHCIYWYISIFIVHIGTYRYSLHILVHVDIYCIIIIQCMSICSNIYNEYQYVQIYTISVGCRAFIVKEKKNHKLWQIYVKT